MTKISAKIVAHSKHVDYNNTIATMEVTFPRFILAELNTHRMMSRNSASSRAIPYKKMIKSVLTNPFIPIAWQKDHSGMQGTEYFSKTERFSVDTFKHALTNIFDSDEELVTMYTDILAGSTSISRTLDEWWLLARDKAIEASLLLACFGITKQLCNRLLEPFMWHTVLITATEWENFFYLRCPKYTMLITANGEERGKEVYRSKKDLLKAEEISDLGINWFKMNTGQAEIHMMALAEAMWDAYNESVPKELKAGEWHIPFMDGLNAKGAYLWGKNVSEFVKVSTAMCARVSYTVVGEEGKEPNYENDIKLHDRLAESGHWSPFEHCARAMDFTEYNTIHEGNELVGDGWSGNFRGFIQYRKTFKNENVTNER